jgi:hypothetical protein
MRTRALATGERRRNGELPSRGLAEKCSTPGPRRGTWSDARLRRVVTLASIIQYRFEFPLCHASFGVALTAVAALCAKNLQSLCTKLEVKPSPLYKTRSQAITSVQNSKSSHHLCTKLEVKPSLRYVLWLSGWWCPMQLERPGSRPIHG